MILSKVRPFITFTFCAVSLCFRQVVGQCCSGTTQEGVTVVPACVSGSSYSPLTVCPPGFNSFIPNGVCVDAGAGSTCVTLGASMVGDPVMQGFDNSTFEFFGNPGFNYSVLAISDLDMAVNMQLVRAGPDHIRHQGGEGTFAGRVAVLLPSFELVATVDESGNMTVIVNGVGIDNQVPSAWPDVYVAYEPYVPGLGQTITVTRPPFKLRVVAVKSYTHAESGLNRGHLDLHAELDGPVASSVSGVLGQTLGVFDPSTLAEDRFEVPSLSFRNFGTIIASMSRRLASFKPEAFPMHAGMMSSLRPAI